MKLHSKRLLTLLLIFILGIGLFACDANDTTTTTETTSHPTTGTWYVALNPGIYQDVDDFLNTNSTQRYMSIEIDYEYTESDNLNDFSYYNYFGIDFQDLYLGSIVTSNYDNSLIPNAYRIEQIDGILYRFEDSIQTVINESNLQVAYNNLVDLDISELENIYDMEVSTTSDGRKNVELDHNRVLEKIPSLFNYFPELANFDSLTPFTYN